MASLFKIILIASEASSSSEVNASVSEYISYVWPFGPAGGGCHM